MSTILIIDDNADLRDAMALLLEQDGFKILTASDGAAALELLKSPTTPQLILCDLSMSGMDGFKFLAERSRSETLSKIPVIVVSGETHQKEAAVRAGANAFLGKPFRPGDLHALVNRIKRIKQSSL